MRTLPVLVVQLSKTFMLSVSILFCSLQCRQVAAALSLWKQ